MTETDLRVHALARHRNMLTRGCGIAALAALAAADQPLTARMIGDLATYATATVREVANRAVLVGFATKGPVPGSFPPLMAWSITDAGRAFVAAHTTEAHAEM